MSIRVVDHRIHPDAGETGLPPGVRVERTDPHQPVHPGLGLQPAIGVGAGDLQRRRFDAGLFALALFQQLHFVAVLLRPPHIHPHQHFRPILGFRAARAGVQFDVAIVGVGLTGQQAFDLAPLRFLGQSAQTRGGLRRHGGIAIGLGEFDQFQRIGDVGFQLAHRRPSATRAYFSPASTPGPERQSFHRLGSSARLFSSARRASATSQSKMPPQQRDGLPDLVVESVGFGGHDADLVLRGSGSIQPAKFVVDPAVHRLGPLRAGASAAAAADHALGHRVVRCERTRSSARMHAGNCSTGRPLNASAMNSCQIGAATTPPSSCRPRL